MKLVGYVRVSTQGQVDDGLGLEIQEKALRRWAREHRHRLVAIHRDEGISGATDDREGLTEALAAIKYDGAKGLLVHSLDRLARSLTVQEAALQQVWAAGGQIFTVDTGEVLADDPDDPVRTFVRQILGAVSQLEAGMIARRLRRGRQHKAEQGGYAHGSPPMGYRAEGGKLIEDQDEMAVVARMRELRDDGVSLRGICDVLTAEGMKPKRSDRWHPMTVARILKRRTT